MNKKLVALACVVMGLLLLGGLFIGTGPGSAVAAIPTPVGAQAGGGDWVIATYSIGGDFTNAFDTATGSGIHDPAYSAVDLTYTVDVSGTVWVTCTLQFSNDNTSWANGRVLLAVTADTTVISQTELFGRYSRVRCIESEGAVATATYTVTIMGKLMN